MGLRWMILVAARSNATHSFSSADWRVCSSKDCHQYPPIHRNTLLGTSVTFNRGQFLSFRDQLAMSAGFLLSQLRGGGLGAYWRPVVETHDVAQETPTQRTIQPKTSMVLRLRNTCLGVGSVAQWESTCLAWQSPEFSPSHQKEKRKVAPRHLFQSWVEIKKQLNYRHCRGVKGPGDTTKSVRHFRYIISLRPFLDGKKKRYMLCFYTDWTQEG